MLCEATPPYRLHPRLLSLLMAVALCGGVGVVTSAHAGPLARCQAAPGPWTTTDTPPDSSFLTTTEQAHGVSATNEPGVGLTVDPANPKDVLFANARQLFRTLDGGCTWQLALSLDNQPGTSSTAAQVAASVDQMYTITSVAVASTSTSTNHEMVYVVATENLANDMTLDELPTLLLVSTDGGATFHEPQPLPSASAPDAPQGTPTCENTTVEVAPSDPKTAYLQCEQQRLDELVFTFYGGIIVPTITNETPLFVTHDAGQSWTQVSSPLTLVATQPAQSGDTVLSNTEPAQPDFIVDPRQPNTLWTTRLESSSTSALMSGSLGFYSNALWRSTDAGATWTKVFAPANVQLAGVDAEYPPSGPERIVTWTQSVNGNFRLPQAYLSVNGGKSWLTLPPVPVTAIPKVAGASQAWADPPFEDVTLAAATKDILAVMDVTGDYGAPSASCTHAEAARYNVKRHAWLPVPTPKETVANPHGISLSWPVSDHRGLATTTYYASSTNCAYSGSTAPVLLSYTDHTQA